MSQGFCQFHQREETLCKAHILPRSFYRRVAQATGEEGFWIVAKGEEHAKRAHAGLYDRSILCRAADSEFGIYDNYAVNFFSVAMPEKIHCTPDGRQWFMIGAYDFHLLTLFLLSYVWRCHHSVLSPYKNFSIGKSYETRILAKLQMRDSCPVHWMDYVVTIFYSGTDDIIFPLKFPFAQKIQGINYLVLYFLNFKVILKLDGRTTPGWFNFAAASADKPLVAPATPYNGSSEHENDLSGLRETLSRGVKW
jgi:hypothetical protein